MEHPNAWRNSHVSRATRVRDITMISRAVEYNRVTLKVKIWREEDRVPINLEENCPHIHGVGEGFAE